MKSSFSALNVTSNAFSVTQNKAQCIIVLTRQGPFVRRRDHGMTIEDVKTVIDHNREIQCTHLVGIFGEKHPD